MDQHGHSWLKEAALFHADIQGFRPMESLSSSIYCLQDYDGSVHPIQLEADKSTEEPTEKGFMDQAWQ